MLEKWKNRKKRGTREEAEEKKTGKLPVARFRDLPMALQILVVNVSLLLILTAVFFMAGAYLYSPQEAGRSYLEACLAGDWNAAYDVCQFPDTVFLNRKNYVNAKTWEAAQNDQAESQPEIKSFFMRRKESQETGKNRIYTVRYTLRGVSESQESTYEITKGDHVKAGFYEWYVVPTDAYVTDVQITVPKAASFYLDGTLVKEEYLKETKDDQKIYQIPYLFLGGHTVELTEKQKDAYREIIEVKDNSSLEFLPDLKLNDSTGKIIADRIEDAWNKICTAAAKKADFATIQQEFSSDAKVQKQAKESYQKFCDLFADEASFGITKLAVTGISTSVSNENEQMQVDVAITATAEKLQKFLILFKKTRTESLQWNLQSEVVLENGTWVLKDTFFDGIFNKS